MVISNVATLMAEYTPWRHDEGKEVVTEFLAKEDVGVVASLMLPVKKRTYHMALDEGNILHLLAPPPVRFSKRLRMKKIGKCVST